MGRPGLGKLLDPRSSPFGSGALGLLGFSLDSKIGSMDCDGAESLRQVARVAPTGPDCHLRTFCRRSDKGADLRGLTVTHLGQRGPSLDFAKMGSIPCYSENLRPGYPDLGLRSRLPKNIAPCGAYR